MRTLQRERSRKEGERGEEEMSLHQSLAHLETALTTPQSTHNTSTHPLEQLPSSSTFSPSSSPPHFNLPPPLSPALAAQMAAATGGIIAPVALSSDEEEQAKRAANEAAASTTKPKSGGFPLEVLLASGGRHRWIFNDGEGTVGQAKEKVWREWPQGASRQPFSLPPPGEAFSSAGEVSLIRSPLTHVILSQNGRRRTQDRCPSTRCDCSSFSFLPFAPLHPSSSPLTVTPFSTHRLYLGRFLEDSKTLACSLSYRFSSSLIPLPLLPLLPPAESPPPHSLRPRPLYTSY
jgi:hypothetical protein